MASNWANAHRSRVTFVSAHTGVGVDTSVTKLVADVIARYHRLYGREVYFLTGADEHGQKIADTAAASGVQPIELCDKHVAMFKALQPAPHPTGPHPDPTDPKPHP